MDDELRISDDSLTPEQLKFNKNRYTVQVKSQPSEKRKCCDARIYRCAASACFVAYQGGLGRPKATVQR